MSTFNWKICPAKFHKLFKEAADSNKSSLNLRDLRLTREDIPCIGEFVQAYHITHLDLSFNDIRDEGATALKACKSLISLNVQKNNIGNDGAIAIASMNLQELNISYNQVSFPGAQAFALSKTLKRLNLGHNDIGVPGAEACALSQSITMLFVNNNGIGNRGSNALAQSTNIKVLSVAFNQITNEGLMFFPLNDTLETLDMSFNAIDDEGATILAQNETLLDLIMRNNAIEDNGAIALANRIKAFRILDIRDNDIGDTGMSALRKREQEEINKQKTQSSILTILEKELDQPIPLPEISFMPSFKVLHSCAFLSETAPTLPSKSKPPLPQLSH